MGAEKDERKKADELQFYKKPEFWVPSKEEQEEVGQQT